eukprot:5599218-Prymnesium_polylepis.1
MSPCIDEVCSRGVLADRRRALGCGCGRRPLPRARPEPRRLHRVSRAAPHPRRQRATDAPGRDGTPPRDGGSPPLASTNAAA